MAALHIPLHQTSIETHAGSSQPHYIIASTSQQESLSFGQAELNPVYDSPARATAMLGARLLLDFIIARV
jgi:hypothetical protein